jgi:transcriptional regulator with GAF, ATPase, and Fis domain
VLRLIEEADDRDGYDTAWVVASPAGERPAETLMRDLSARVANVHLRTLAGVEDPSDYAQLFRALGPLVGEVERERVRRGLSLDVVLSAGTPQAQTLWVILVQSGALHARMLQVIPSAFVPAIHDRAVREVRLDIDGFPEIRALRDEVARLRAESRARQGPLVGQSEPMEALAARLARVAATDIPVLVLGETGTGKELVARQIHAQSTRARGPFVAENCGAFAEGVLASELFGHEPGAFTGAAGRRRGLFEQAHGGTLFLDEVGELAPRVQATLLRVLQDGTLRRVGGESRVRVDVRVIAATHRDLGAMVREGAFREDLYYRLRGATLELPPLRQRLGDLALLVDVFAREAKPASSGKAALHVSPEAMRALVRYSWPGNVRELRAEVLRWSVFCDDRVELADLSPEIRASPPTPSPPRTTAAVESAAPHAMTTLADAVLATERAAIKAALDATGGNLAQAARALDIDRNTLKRKLARDGLR